MILKLFRDALELPNGAQGCRRGAQKSPKRPQGRPKSAQGRPKIDPKAPKSVQERQQVGPIGVHCQMNSNRLRKEYPERRKTVLPCKRQHRCHFCSPPRKDAEKGPKRAPKGAQIHENGSPKDQEKVLEILLASFVVFWSPHGRQRDQKETRMRPKTSKVKRVFGVWWKTHKM